MCLKKVNAICCIRLVWRIASQAPYLWVRWIQTYLIRDENFWFQKERPNTGSWMWRKLLKYKALAQEFFEKKIKSGAQASFWFDNWSVLGRIYDITGHRGIIDTKIFMKPTAADSLHNRRRRHHRADQLVEIEVVLRHQETLLVGEGEDNSLWKHGKGIYKPSFSSKSTWNQLRVHVPSVDCSRAIWFKHSTPKYFFLPWLAIQDRLSTCDRMSKWDQSINTGCVLYSGAMETRNHLFFECAYNSAEVWGKLMKRVLKAQYMEDWIGLLQVLTAVNQLRAHNFLTRYVFQLAIHSIWKERNGRQHGEAPVRSSTIVKVMDKAVRN